ncbi:MAG: hypothetical protein WBN48_13170, partial [Thiogranum sp.]
PYGEGAAAVWGAGLVAVAVVVSAAAAVSDGNQPYRDLLSIRTTTAATIAVLVPGLGNHTGFISGPVKRCISTVWCRARRACTINFNR